MPQLEWVVDVGDLVIALIGLVLIPLMRMLMTTLWSVRDAVRELTLIVVGSDKNPEAGLIGEVSSLKKESQRHRTWLIELQAEQGVRRDDRS